jgi:hypothetical protein
MRRTASEVLRSLEMRVARLEREADIHGLDKTRYTGERLTDRVLSDIKELVGNSNLRRNDIKILGEKTNKYGDTSYILELGKGYGVIHESEEEGTYLVNEIYDSLQEVLRAVS